MTPQLIALVLTAAGPEGELPDPLSEDLVHRAEPPAAEPEPEPAPFVVEENTAVPRPVVTLVADDPGVLRRRMQWHDERDAKLVRVTTGFGVATGVLGALGAILVSLAPRSDSPKATGAMTATGGIFLTGAAVSFVGTVITGAVLGNHRNHRGHFMP